jgi:hypothetical protein
VSIVSRLLALERTRTERPYRAVIEQWERPDGTLTELQFIVYARTRGEFTCGTDRAAFEAFAAAHPVVVAEHVIWTLPKDGAP